MAVLTNTMLQGTAAISDEESYQIQKSLRFNEVDSATFLRTIGSTGNRRTWTWAAWVKRWDIGNRSTLFSCGNATSDAGWLGIEIETSDKLRVSGWNTLYKETNRVFRDPSAWFHVVVAFDTTQESADNRIKMYVNGELETSLGTSNNPSEDASSYPVNESGKPNRIGGRDPGGVAYNSNFYLADNYFIDGLALSPAAFGSFDDAGVWNPKKFALPTPNQGTTYSSGASNTGNVWSAHTNNETFQPAAVFDGSLTTGTGPYAASGGSGTQGTCTFPVGTQTGKHHFRHYGRLYADGKWEDQDGNIIYESFTDDNSNKWYDLGWHSDVTSLKITAGSHGNTSDVYALEVDGLILQDGKTDPTTLSNPNNGTQWSSQVSGNFNGGYVASNAFDGKVGGSWAIPNDGQDVTWTTSITAKSQIRLFLNKNGTGGTLTQNGTDLTSGLTSGDQWVNLPSKTLTALVWGSNSSNNQIQLMAVEVDGHILVDSTLDNSFHLKFNDTSTKLNRYIAKDTLNGKIADATGGLPIHNTTDDYGDVKGSGNRTDSDSSNLKLAIGNAFTDSSGNSTNVSANGAVVSTDQSRFYGSSIFFDSSDDSITTAGSLWSANGNQTFEAWLWVNDFDSTRNIMHTGGNGDIAVTDDNQIRIHPDSANWMDTPSIVPLQQWFHLAVTQSSNDRKVYINGTEQAMTIGGGSPKDDAWANPTGTLMIGDDGQRSFYDGYMQDIRVYDKIKYTANFKPPNRNDFQEYNILVNPDTIYSTRKYTGSNYGIPKFTGHRPDLILIKHENTSDNIVVTDSMRGVTKELNTNNDTAETTQSGGVTTIFDGGFLLGSGNAAYNTGGGDHFWCTTFKAGNAASANSDGTISSTVNANVTGAFGIVKWTGTGSNGTIGHGLGRVPSVIWAKRYDNTGNWICYHKSIGAEKYMKLNTADAEVDDATAWQDTEPTSDVFSVGTLADLNASGASMIAYIWCDTPGIVESGVYAGQGSTKTVDTSFPFKFCFIKSHDTASQEWVWKTTTTGGDKTLYFDNTTAVATNREVTFNSGNIQIATGSGATNEAGRNFIYMGVGEQYRESDTDVVNDSPTNFEDETTGLSHGNYCTLNEFDYNGGSILNGNLESKNGTHGSWGKGWRGTMGVTSGKWYYEVENAVTSPGTNGQSTTNETNCRVGVATFDWDLDGSPMTGFWGRVGPHGFDNGTEVDNCFTPHGHTEMNGMNAGQKVGVALDMDAGKMYISTDGSFVDSDGSDHSPSTGNTAVGTASGSSHTLFNGNITGTVYPAVMTWGDEAITRLNFGQRAFTHTVPDGYKPWCTHHLPDTFSGDEINNPSKYFDVKTYTGTGGTQDIILPFQPELVWVKCRSHNNWHALVDAIRGTGSTLWPNADNAEASETHISAFNSNGFTVTDADSGTSNESGRTYVGWAWDAGTAASGANNDGTVNISSGNQWVNATAGFSITKVDTDAANTNFGHGLSAKPEFIIAKKIGATSHWHVYLDAVHSSGGYLNLESDGTGSSSSTGTWSQAPDNTKIYTHDNITDGDWIFYAWTPIPGFSHFGTYEGNASSDGLFINCGFRPKYVVTRNIDRTANWTVLDLARDDFRNPVGEEVYADHHSAAGDAPSDSTIDFLSNGFRITDDGLRHNRAETHVYFAFAEHPFKTARAR